MGIPELLDKVQHHLLQVRNDPSQALDQNLLEHVDRQVTGMWLLLSNEHTHAALELLCSY